jgi:hypothetical protein
MLNTPGVEGGNVRRWLWPYAILAVVLSLLGLAALLFFVLGGGAERVGAQLAVADATVVAPLKNFLITMLDLIAPVELPPWLKEVYAVLVIVAVAGFCLSLILGLVLLPVFYALYRSADSD